MDENELLRVREATLLRSKNASTPRAMSYSSICSRCQDFCFIVLDICLAITTTQDKNIAIALAIALVRTS